MMPGKKHRARQRKGRRGQNSSFAKKGGAQHELQSSGRWEQRVAGWKSWERGRKGEVCYSSTYFLEKERKKGDESFSLKGKKGRPIRAGQKRLAPLPTLERKKRKRSRRKSGCPRCGTKFRKKKNGERGMGVGGEEGG